MAPVADRGGKRCGGQACKFPLADFGAGDHDGRSQRPRPRPAPRRQRPSPPRLVLVAHVHFLQGGGNVVVLWNAEAAAGRAAVEERQGCNGNRWTGARPATLCMKRRVSVRPSPLSARVEDQWQRKGGGDRIIVNGRRGDDGDGRHQTCLGAGRHSRATWDLPLPK